MAVVKDIKRINQLVTLLFELGLIQLIDDLELRGYLPFRRAPHAPKPRSRPESIRLFFEKAGGAFLKLGQLLAIRPDLVGPAYSKEFEKLLDHVAAVPYAEIKPILDAHDHRFKQVGKKPLATGSIAQVHKGRLKTGEEVAIKIKIPGTDELFTADIEIMEWLAQKIQDRYQPEIFDPIAIVEEFKRYTRKELDLEHEAANLKRFKSNFKNRKNVLVPTVYYAADDILVMQLIKGKNILELKAAPKSQRAQAVRRVVSCAYTQLFEDGFFHADLHPGNIFIVKGKVCLLDCGIVGYVDSSLRRKLIDLFVALVRGRLEDTAEALVALDTSNTLVDEEVLKEGIYHAIGEYYDRPLREMPLGQVLSDCIDTARKAHLRLPAQMVLFAKSIISLDGLCRELDPDYNIAETGRPYVQRLLKKRFGTRQVLDKAMSSAQAVQEVVVSLPKVMRRFQRRMGLLDERLTDIDKTFDYLSRLIWKTARLVIFALMFSAIIISSALLINTKPQFHYVSVYTMAGAIAAIILLIIIISLMRKEP